MKKTVRDIDVREKRVFVRCDFNVPTDGESAVRCLLSNIWRKTERR